VVNIAIGFSILLVYFISLLIFPKFIIIFSFLSSPIVFSIIVISIFLFLRLTRVYEYLKPNSPIQSIFAISNILIIGSEVFYEPAVKNNANALYIGIFLSLLMYLGLIMLIIATGFLLVQGYRNFKE
jgi:hypothetical protein